MYYLLKVKPVDSSLFGFICYQKQCTVEVTFQMQMSGYGLKRHKGTLVILSSVCAPIDPEVKLLLRRCLRLLF